MNRQQRFGLAGCLFFIWIFLIVPEFSTFGYGSLPWYISLIFGGFVGMFLNVTEP